MAKPINITPVLKGKDALNFFDKLKVNNFKKISSTTLHTIRKDAKALQSITKS